MASRAHQSIDAVRWDRLNSVQIYAQSLAADCRWIIISMRCSGRVQCGSVVLLDGMKIYYIQSFTWEWNLNFVFDLKAYKKIYIKLLMRIAILSSFALATRSRPGCRRKMERVDRTDNMKKKWISAESLGLTLQKMFLTLLDNYVHIWSSEEVRCCRW